MSSLFTIPMLRFRSETGASVRRIVLLYVCGLQNAVIDFPCLLINITSSNFSGNPAKLIAPLYK
jgi:hypothetical protein